MEYPSLTNALEAIASRYGLAEIYAFGSRAEQAAAQARGETIRMEHAESDVDIGVRLKPGVRLSAVQRVQLTEEFEWLFGTPRVDLVLLSEADPFLALDVIRGELLFASDPDAQAEYELYVLRRAGDLAPLKRERIRMILEEGAR